MTYPEAVDHLNHLAPELAPTPGAGPVRKFDLAHMRTLCACLGNPQDRVPAVLIAGTNGKGSTAATLASILTAAGYRTGLYTSPHLFRANERIQLARPTLPTEYGNLQAHTDGPLTLQQIPDEDFARLYTQVDDACTHLTHSGQLPVLPSFFERLTALAFLYYAGPNPKPENCHPERSEAESKDLRLADTTINPNPNPKNCHPERSEAESKDLRLADATINPNPNPKNCHPERSEAESKDPRFLPPSPTLTPAEILIVEVGLGGRLDATNVVTPILSIITDIALDHQDYLGHTIAEITREKCGILRENGTLITLPQLPEANHAIGLAATALNVHAINAADYIPPPSRSADPPLTLHADHSPTDASAAPPPLGAPSIPASSASMGTALSTPPQDCHPERSAAESKDLRLISPASPLPPNRYTLAHPPITVDSPLPGHHQQRNIALAIAAALTLRDRFNIPDQAIEQGIRTTTWPGRLESLSLPAAPGHGPATLLLDVAHNPAGAWTLRSAIAALDPAQPRTLIFSCLRDKNLEEMSRILFPLFDSSKDGDPDRRHDHILLAPISSPRAAHVDDLLAAAHNLQVPAHAAPHLAGALAQARQITPPNGLILATGSVYLVGELRHLALETKNH